MANQNLYAADVILKTGADRVAEEKHIVIFQGDDFQHPVKIASVREAANLALNIIDCFSDDEQTWMFNSIKERMKAHSLRQAKTTKSS